MIMKKVTIVFIFIAITSNILAQGDVVTLTKEKKIGYNFLFEGELNYQSMPDWHILLKPRIGLRLVNSITINDKEHIGIGIAYFMDLVSLPSTPLFINYRHLFNPNKKKSNPILNASMGLNVASYYMSHEHEYYDDFEFGLYTEISGGFVKGNISFSSGIFIRTFPNFTCYGITVRCGVTF